MSMFCCIISSLQRIFDRVPVARFGKRDTPQARIVERVDFKAKALVFQNIPLCSLVTALNHAGFSIAAVTTTLDSSLVSAGCGVKTGWCMPLTASLAALVKRLRNLTTPKRQNGLYADKLTRSAHLAHQT